MEQRVESGGSRPSRAALAAGALATVPILPAIAPFGVIYGTLAIETGLGPVQALAMAALVIAGASQLAALQLLGEGAPLAVILLTAGAVNLRMAMYSASLAPYWRGISSRWRALAAFGLHDQDYALSMVRYQSRPEEAPYERLGFFLGSFLMTVPVWMGSTLVGIELGAHLPAELGLEFFVPLAFLALIAPMLRGRPEVLAAAVAMAVSVVLSDLPYRSGLFVAAAAGIATGVTLRRMRHAGCEVRR